MKLFISLSILLSGVILKAHAVIDSPKFCFSKNSYPCSLEFNQKIAMTHKSFKIEAVPKTQLYFKTEQEWKLISGQVLVETKDQAHWVVFGTQKIKLQGDVIIKELESGVIQLYQLQGVSQINLQDLHPGFLIKIKKGQLQNPEPIPRDQAISLYTPFKRLTAKEINKITALWGDTSEQAAQAYRLLASELDQTKENLRLEQIRQRKDKEAEDLKYKEAFRMRHFNPEKWSEFIDNSDLSP